MTQSTTFQEISPSELTERCRDGELWQLLDVREPWEIEIARVQQTDRMPTSNIPMADIPARYTELEATLPVAVLCHSGGRSARVAAFLIQLPAGRERQRGDRRLVRRGGYHPSALLSTPGSQPASPA
jgi:rhodanese-related sulfurtransferase